MDPQTYPQGTSTVAIEAIVVVSYGALFFNCCATVSALVLANSFNECPAQRGQEGTGPLEDGSHAAIATGLSAICGEQLKLLRWHCGLSLAVGVLCTVIQVLLYVLLQESTTVKVAMLCFAVVEMLPMLLLIPRN